MRKLSGWQKAGLIAGVGCFSILAVLVIGIVIAVVWARSTVAELGDTTPTRVERTIALDAPTATSSGQAARSAPSGAAPLRLRIDLEEGSFTIRPGPAGGSVQVQGTYAANLYELTEQQSTDASGPQATILFRSKTPAWARFLSGMLDGDSGDRPELTVLIPQGAPMDLALRVSMGESHIDLGGLTLRELDLDVSMGEHRIDFGQPVVGEMRRVRLDASMGNVSVENLGNARAQAVESSTSMGNVTADLGGGWQPGDEAALSFTQSMGELTLRVPSAVRLETDVRNSDGEPGNRTRDSAVVNEPADPNAPRLRVRVTSSMGESRIIRY